MGHFSRDDRPTTLVYQAPEYAHPHKLSNSGNYLDQSGENPPLHSLGKIMTVSDLLTIKKKNVNFIGILTFYARS
jgi:hypothetical protein